MRKYYGNNYNKRRLQIPHKLKSNKQASKQTNNDKYNDDIYVYNNIFI